MTSKSKNATIEESIKTIEDKMNSLDYTKGVGDGIKLYKNIKDDLDTVVKRLLIQENKMKTLEDKELEEIEESEKDSETSDDLTNDSELNSKIKEIEDFTNRMKKSSSIIEKVTLCKKIKENIRLCKRYQKKLDIEITKLE